MIDKRSVDWMCLAERERTEKEVWSSVRKDLRSFKDTFFISLRSWSSFLNDWDDLGGELKPVELSPLINILWKSKF